MRVHLYRIHGSKQPDRSGHRWNVSHHVLAKDLTDALEFVKKAHPEISIYNITHSGTCDYITVDAKERLENDDT